MRDLRSWLLDLRLSLARSSRRFWPWERLLLRTRLASLRRRLGGRTRRDDEAGDGPRRGAEPADAKAQGAPPPSHRVAVALLLCAGLLVAHYPMLLSGLGLMQTDLGDTRFNNYVLEHGFRWLVGDPLHASFWDAPFYFPTLNTIAYSDNMLTVQPLYWLGRGLGLRPDTAFQLWMLATATLNFAVAYAVVRRLGRVGPIAAAGGAALFAFASFRNLQLGHQQLTGQYFALLAVLAVAELVATDPSALAERRRGRWLVALGAAAWVAQLYASFYQGWLLTLGLAVAALWALADRHRRRRLRDVLGAQAPALAVAGIAAGIALAPMAEHYLEAARLVGPRALAQDGLPSPLSWLSHGDRSWLYRSIELQRSDDERNLGSGFVTLGLVAVGLWSTRRRPLARLWLFGTGLLVLLFTNVFDPRDADALTGWRLLYHTVPGASAIRSPARVMFLLLVPMAFGLAWALERLVRTGRAKLALCLCAVVLLEQGSESPSYDKERGRRRAAALAAQIPERCAVFYYSPSRPLGVVAHLDAMWASLALGLPTINGYAGNEPPGFELSDGQVDSPLGARRVERDLERWLRGVTVPPEQRCWIRMRLADGDEPDTAAAGSVPSRLEREP